MTETSEFTRASSWDGKDLTGKWEINFKADGVRVFHSEEGWISRAGKDLYNIPAVDGPHPTEGYEVYLNRTSSSKDNFTATIEAVRAKNKPERAVLPSDLYSLGNPVDSRLLCEFVNNPTAELINLRMQKALAAGWEGLILRGPSGQWLKVKPKETYDVTVTEVVQGRGKHAGRMGALVTSRGKVGTGFSDADREFWFTGDKVGTIIEVECLHLTNDGKFRHPRFVQIRTDKTETDDI